MKSTRVETHSPTLNSSIFSPSIDGNILSRESILRLVLGLIEADTKRCSPQVATLQNRHYDLTQNMPKLNMAFEISPFNISDKLGLDSLSLLTTISQVVDFFGLSRTGVDDYLLIDDSLDSWVRLIFEHTKINPRSLEITFKTSGSTGIPKKVTHPIDAILTEVQDLLTGVLKATPKRIISLVPPHHMFGFVHTVALPDALGIETISLLNRGPTAASRVAKPGDLLITTPFHLNILASSGATFCKDVAGISSGAPCNESAWRAAQEIGLNNLFDIYGSTESGGIGRRSSFENDFELFPSIEKKEPSSFSRTNTAIEIQDNLKFSSDRLFSLEGRKDGAVQIGGINVFMEDVKRIILESDFVEDAILSTDNNKLCAYIIPYSWKSNESDIRNDLEKRFLLSSTPNSRPSLYIFENKISTIAS